MSKSQIEPTTGFGDEPENQRPGPERRVVRLGGGSLVSSTASRLLDGLAVEPARAATLSNDPAMSRGPLSKRAGRVGEDRPRLVTVEGMVLTTPLDPYFPLRALATYSGCSIRWLRQRLTDPESPLPCYRVNGKILVRRSEFDAWIERFHQTGDPSVERLLRDVLKEDGA